MSAAGNDFYSLGNKKKKKHSLIFFNIIVKTFCYAQGENHQEAAKGPQDADNAGAEAASNGQPGNRLEQNGNIDIQDGEIQSTWHEVHETFDDMNLDPQLLRGIYGYGFEKPSTIQQRAIVPCIKGHDVIAQAQSGTGKTATDVCNLNLKNSVYECS